MTFRVVHTVFVNGIRLERNGLIIRQSGRFVPMRDISALKTLSLRVSCHLLRESDFLSKNLLGPFNKTPTESPKGGTFKSERLGFFSLNIVHDLRWGTVLAHLSQLFTRA